MMPAGLQVWDAAGNLMVDASTRLTKIIGSAQMSGSGSVGVTAPEGNELWAFFIPSGDGYVFPSIGISGSTISWSYPGSDSRVPGLLLYGSY